MKVFLLGFLFILTAFSQEKPELVLPGKVFTAQDQAYYITNDNIWVFEGDMVIERGARVIIAQGTTIKFRPNMDRTASGKDREKSELIVRGELVALGGPKESSQITFTSASKENPRAGDWYGIVIYRGGNVSRISYCNIEYAYRGLSCYGSSPRITSSSIRYSFNTGVYISAKSGAMLRGNTIYSSGYAGVEVLLKSSPTLNANQIFENEYGIMIYDSSNPNLGSNDKETLNPGQNSIQNNFEYDVFNHSSAQIRAENNNWSTTVVAEIKKTIFDGNQHASYGLVDVIPISSLTAAESNRKALEEQEKAIARAETKEAKPKRAPVRKQPKTTASNTVAQNTETKKPEEQTTTQTQIPVDTASATNVRSEDLIAQNESPIETDTDAREVATAKIEDKPEEKSTEPAKPEEPNYTQRSINQPYIQSVLDPQTGVEINRVVPTYKGIARSQNIKGRVIMKLIVGFDGKVERVDIIKSDHPSLEALAIEAAEQFRYTPPKIKGQAVRFETSMRFRFK